MESPRDTPRERRGGSRNQGTRREPSLKPTKHSPGFTSSARFHMHHHGMIYFFKRDGMEPTTKDLTSVPRAPTLPLRGIRGMYTHVSSPGESLTQPCEEGRGTTKIRTNSQKVSASLRGLTRLCHTASDPLNYGRNNHIDMARKAGSPPGHTEGSQAST